MPRKGGDRLGEGKRQRKSIFEYMEIHRKEILK